MENSNERYSAATKAKIVLEALRSSETDSSIAEAYQVHPVTLSRWKKEFERNADKVFGCGDELDAAQSENASLERQIVALEAELSILRDLFEHDIGIDTKVDLVNRYKDDYGLNRSCAAVSLPKSTYYYRMDDSG